MTVEEVLGLLGELRCNGDINCETYSMLHDAISSIEEAPRWISVKKRLPEPPKGENE